MGERFTIGNAACSVAKTPEDIEALADTYVDIITVGSITYEERTGNPEPRLYMGDGYTLNSLGMPNRGAKYYTEQLPGMIKTAHEAGKELSLSIAGFKTEEWVELARVGDIAGVDSLELNLGCPNVSINGEQKPIASFDIASIEEIVESVRAVTQLPLSLKLSIYSNPAELQAVAKRITELGMIDTVVTSNTFPNAYMSKGEDDVLANIYGGLSGHDIQPIALGQVRQFRQHLPDTIGVIGVGGIETIDDVERFRRIGASGIQAATLIVRRGHYAMDLIATVRMDDEEMLKLLREDI